MKKQINILWTGGLDSTYRVLELSTQEVTIQPYYLASVNPSTEREIQAIHELTETIKSRKETKCELLPVKVVEGATIAPNEAIYLAWERLFEKTHLGSQYEFIARFAAQHNLVLELGIEKDPLESTIQRCLDMNGGGIIKEGYVTAHCETEDMRLIFSNMRFPLPLFEMTKQDEIAKYKEWHAEEVLSKIWFCYRPVNGKPCGLCDPCQTYIEVGLGNMIPANRLILYYMRKHLSLVFQSLRNIKHWFRDIRKKKK